MVGDGGNASEANENSNGVNMNQDVSDSEMHANHNDTTEVNMEKSIEDIFDPKNWSKIEQNLIGFLVENGPRRIVDFNFPSDKNKKHFSTTYYLSLLASCIKLEDYLSYGTRSNIDGRDLYTELKIMKRTLPAETKKPLEILHYLQKLQACFPNVWVAFRIFLTVLVTVATAERSFSKLKLIKSYLRSSMLQERLNGLAMIAIEIDIAEKIDLS